MKNKPKNYNFRNISYSALTFSLLGLTGCFDLGSMSSVVQSSVENNTKSINRNCSYSVEYTYQLGSSVNVAAASFSASSVGGTYRVTESDCPDVSVTGLLSLVADQSISKSNNVLTMGSDKFKINGSSLNASSGTACDQGIATQQSLETGTIDSSTKQVALLVNHIKTTDNCSASISAVFTAN